MCARGPGMRQTPASNAVSCIRLSPRMHKVQGHSMWAHRTLSALGLSHSFAAKIVWFALLVPLFDGPIRSDWKVLHDLLMGLHHWQQP